MALRNRLAALFVTVGVIAGVAASGVAAEGPAKASRIAGASRYDTAAQFAIENWTSPVPVALVVTGAAFPDALASSLAAASLGGPILLTERDSLPSATIQALQALSPGRIVVVGGDGAVSDTVLAMLDGYTAGDVQRVAGANRYETAAAVSRFAFGNIGTGGTVMLASGRSFADAVGGAAAAAATPNPLLLTEPGELPSSTAAELERLAPSTVFVLGGTSAVSDAVVAAIQARGLSVTRIAGADRYATAALIATTIFGQADTVYLATGLNFPDALVAAAMGIPILLLPAGTVPQSVLDALEALAPTLFVVIGGTSAVTDEQATTAETGEVSTPAPTADYSGWNTTAHLIGAAVTGDRFDYECPAGGTFYSVWGTDVYSADSSVCTAAVHDGWITREAGGTVTIEIRDGQLDYQGSILNGVTSQSWSAAGTVDRQPYFRSFAVIAGPSPTVPPDEPVLGTGDVQVTLRWQSTADLDLAVVDPDGNNIHYPALNPAPNGGVLDVDSNASCNPPLTTSPVENIYWPVGQAPTGTYTINVTYYEDCGGGETAHQYTVTVKVDGVETEVFQGTMTSTDLSRVPRVHTFTR